MSFLNIALGYLQVIITYREVRFLGRAVPQPMYLGLGNYIGFLGNFHA